MNVLEPAQTEWATSVPSTPKKDRTLRFCAEYRNLNALTIRDSYPLQRMDRRIDTLRDAQMFWAVDVNSSYTQLEVDPSEHERIAFTSEYELYQLTRMSFGSKNVPAIFQRVVDSILSWIEWHITLPYLDHIIIFSRTLREHINHTRYVLSLLKKADANLRVKSVHSSRTKSPTLVMLSFKGD